MILFLLLPVLLFACNSVQTKLREGAAQVKSCAVVFFPLIITVDQLDPEWEPAVMIW